MSLSKRFSALVDNLPVVTTRKRQRALTEAYNEAYWHAEKALDALENNRDWALEAARSHLYAIIG